MRNGKIVAAFAVLLVASFAAMNAMPADTLPTALLQEAVLALAALAVARFAVPDAFKRCTESVQQQNLIRLVAASLLLVGFVGCVISLVTWDVVHAGVIGGFELPQMLSAGKIARNLLLLLGVCLLTGLYEESFIRVLGIEAFEGAMKEGRGASKRPVSEHATDGLAIPGDIERGIFRQPVVFDAAAKRAVVASALLFALLHVGVPDVLAGQLVLMQAALKFVQALLFGVIMGMLYTQTRRLWPCALIHAGFDVLYLGPCVLLPGTMPETYASGAASDTVLLSVTTLMLAGAILKIRKEIAR